MTAKKALADIRQDLEAYVGQRIKLRANRGRKKIDEKIGVLEKTYPHIFVIKLDEKKAERRITFSYSDVLTQTVELSFWPDEDVKSNNKEA